jgi:hypothetical protein
MAEPFKVNFSEIYDKLLNLDVQLEDLDNPSPSYINRKLTECAKKMSEVQMIYINQSRALTVAKRNLSIESAELEILKRKALVNNEAIRKKYTTAKERESAVDEMYEENNKRISELENDVADFQNVLATIRTHIQLLRARNSDIKTQARLTELQILKLNILPTDDPAIKEYAKTLGDLSKLEEEIDLNNVESLAEDKEPEEIVSDNIDADIVDVIGGNTEEKAPETNKLGQVQSATEDIDLEGVAVVVNTTENPESSEDIDMSSLLGGLDELPGVSILEVSTAVDTKEELSSDITSIVSEDEENPGEEGDSISDILNVLNEDDDLSEKKVQTPSNASETKVGVKANSKEEKTSEKVQSKKEPIKEDSASASESGIDLDDLLKNL